jgi:hypothetical protein
MSRQIIPLKGRTDFRGPSRILTTEMIRVELRRLGPLGPHNTAPFWLGNLRWYEGDIGFFKSVHYPRFEE